MIHVKWVQWSQSSAPAATSRCPWPQDQEDHHGRNSPACRCPFVLGLQRSDGSSSSGRAESWNDHPWWVGYRKDGRHGHTKETQSRIMQKYSREHSRQNWARPELQRWWHSTHQLADLVGAANKTPLRGKQNYHKSYLKLHKKHPKLNPYQINPYKYSNNIPLTSMM